jgi:hypothetical protein
MIRPPTKQERVALFLALAGVAVATSPPLLLFLEEPGSQVRPMHVTTLCVPAMLGTPALVIPLAIANAVRGRSRDSLFYAAVSALLALGAFILGQISFFLILHFMELRLKP